MRWHIARCSAAQDALSQPPDLTAVNVGLLELNTLTINIYKGLDQLEAGLSDRVTIAQVAEEAGVSAMTVSNVLNGRPGASEETRRRVLSAAERLGYQPNLSARNLKAGRTGLVGVMTLDLTGQYGLEIVRGIADELASDEREMLISATYQEGVRERDRVEFLATRAGGRRPDGGARARGRHDGVAAPQAPAVRGDRPAAP